MADADTAHVETYCDGCDNTDDHPKEHVSMGGVVESFHYDCLPAKHVKTIRESVGHHDADVKLGFIEKARSGVRGDKLRAHIFKAAPAPKESE